MSRQTPEGRVKAKIKDVLNERKPLLWYYMPVPNGYGIQTIDFIGCFRGDFFAIEAKAPGEEPTQRQEGTIADMRDAYGKVFVIDGDTGELEQWLHHVTTRFRSNTQPGS